MIKNFIPPPTTIWLFSLFLPCSKDSKSRLFLPYFKTFAYSPSHREVLKLWNELFELRETWFLLSFLNASFTNAFSCKDEDDVCNDDDVYDNGQNDGYNLHNNGGGNSMESMVKTGTCRKETFRDMNNGRSDTDDASNIG